MADLSKRVLDCDDCEDGERGERGERGKRGKRGHRGHDGHDGHDGDTGPTGATGETGTAPASIIPFASGTPEQMTHLPPGLLDTGFVVGFGSSGPNIVVGGATIDLTGGPALITNMAFSMPRDGTLVQLSAFFSNVLQVALPPGTGASVSVEIYRSTTPDNIFSPTGVAVTMPLPDGLLAVGTFFSATAPFAFAVSNEDRLLLVASLKVAGVVTPIVAVTGYISAGLAIA
jgi:BclB C-terminal domain-containing protein